MRKPKYWPLVEKSRSACIAAIETYNRASVQYREETFAILMINAWELLLKARVMKENGGKVSSIHAYKIVKNKKGEDRKQYIKTRTGLNYSIGVWTASGMVHAYTKDGIDLPCAHNIQALLEIRDNAVHFVSKSAQLRKALGEISLACVRNYVLASQKWFGMRFDDLNIASIPVTFDLDQQEIEAVAKKPGVAVIKFLKHMQALEKDASGTNSKFSFSIVVSYDVQKKKVDGAVPAHLVGPHEHAEVVMMIDENAIPAGYDWTYQELISHLRKRYSDFGATAKFHKLNKKLREDKANCIIRYLNPKKKAASTTTRFYNPNIIKHFDKHYSVK